MTNMLRKHASETAAPLVGRLPFPEMVVHVNAPPAVLEARVGLRNKPSHTPSRYFSGEFAHEVGRSLARQWTTLWGRHEAMFCLRGWNRWRCRSELCEEELVALLEEAIIQPLTEKDEAALRCEPLPERVRWLHDACVDRGVHLLNVVNDGRESPEVIAMRIVEEIKRLNDNGRESNDC